MDAIINDIGSYGFGRAARSWGSGGAGFREGQMLTVTDAALQHLHAALSQGEASRPGCFRFTQRGEDALGLVVEEPDSGDQTFDYDGDTVLATPEPLFDLLSQRVLDVDPEGQLVLVPQPNPG
jgi:hypothetical protein